MEAGALGRHGHSVHTHVAAGSNNIVECVCMI